MVLSLFENEYTTHERETADSIGNQIFKS